MPSRSAPQADGSPLRSEKPAGDAAYRTRNPHTAPLETSSVLHTPTSPEQKADDAVLLGALPRLAWEPNSRASLLSNFWEEDTAFFRQTDAGITDTHTDFKKKETKKLTSSTVIDQLPFSIIGTKTIEKQNKTKQNIQ